MPVKAKRKSKNETKFKTLLKDIKTDPVYMGRLLGFDKLSDIHNEWIHYLLYSENKSEAPLLAHRGSFKSTMLIVGIVHTLFEFPETRILYMTATASNADKVMRQVKALYQSDMLRYLYSLKGISEPIDKSNWRADSISLTTKKSSTKEGNLEVASVQTTITGRHYDWVINDDIASLMDRFSHAKREQTKQAYQDEMSIIEPDGIISNIGTRYHKEDVYSLMPKGRVYPIGSVEIEGLTLEAIKRIKDNQTPSFYASQYLLQILPDTDRLFKLPEFYESVPDNIKLIAWLDPSFTEKGDYSALTVGGIYEDKLYVVAGKVWRSAIDESYKILEKMFEIYNFNNLYVESNAAQRLIVYELKKRGVPTTEIVNTKNKHLRITNFVLPNWKDLFFNKDVDKGYLDQILEYTETSDYHDDAPDSLAGLISILRPAKPAFKPTYAMPR